MYKILVADDHPLFRDAIRHVLVGRWPTIEIIEVDVLQEGLEKAETDPDIDLVLLDLNMPGAEGFSGLLTLRNNCPMLPVVIISADENAETIHRAMTCGAVGFIPKSSPGPEIAEAVHTVLSGLTYIPTNLKSELDDQRQKNEELRQKAALLTPAELGVFELLTKGQPNKIIAFELDIKESTVKAHISSILRKLGVNSRTQAVLMAKNLDF